MNRKQFSMISSVTDLNRDCKVCDPAMRSIVGAHNVCGKAAVCANHGASTAAHVSTNRGPLCRRAKGKVVLVPRSVPVHGVRATDLSGEPARHRGVSARPALEAVPPRDSFDGRTQYARQCECGARGASTQTSRRACAIARPLYVDEPYGVDLKESVYALDTTTIDLCLSVCS